MTYPRYAIYVLPEPGPLADFGAAWMQWDPRSGTTPGPPQLPELPMRLADITQTPRRYGFHGTIKPPFRLHNDQTETDLQSALESYCTRTAPVALEALELARLGRFLALVPVGNTAGLMALAADVVREFDRFRAPLNAPELERRRQGGLSARQEAMLHEWGYPYVMEEFRFHLTLTGKLPKAKAAALADTLAPVLAPLLHAPCAIRSLSLMGEGGDGMFRQIACFALTGQS
ncbi:DUF1045 domain-containing protein [Roseovarius sp. CAU 1744]|uniref:DUF1045 domain-containing protein n=1 Tax=Roseovarius sp. CAU 1744 TaxID=3140368 RepID=UPI00325BF424